jgi:glycosyltransferase involved in cell wall biosynthesis
MVAPAFPRHTPAHGGRASHEVRGVPDAVEHGRTGLLVSPGDPAALAKALLRVVGDPKLTARMGQDGRERAARLFSWESIARDHLALFGV